MTGLLTSLALQPLVLRVVERAPDDEEVVAGPWGALVLGLLVVAVVLLMVSFTRRLRKAQAAKDAGVYGDEPTEPTEPAGPGESPAR